MLVPWGQVRSTNGDFVVDAESAAAVIEAFRQHGTDLVIDYEHQSLGGRYAAPSGLAPAAGWITGLEVRDGEGIWGKVRWTLAAARRIVRQEYRFLSPVVIVRRDDRKVTSLDSVALTNRPAIAGMQPVVNRNDGSPWPVIDGPVEAGRDCGSGEMVSKALTKEVGMQDELKQLRELLSLGDDAGEQEVVRQACSRLGALIESTRQREAVERVACAMQAGKVCEAQKQWATQFALRDPTGFDGWVADAPVLVPLQRIVPDGQATTGDGQAQREAVIAAARGEYKDNMLLQRLTGEQAYVNTALAEAGLGIQC